MKRIGYLYDKICSIDNLILAEKKARLGKSKQYGVKLFDKNPQDLIINLHHILLNKEYKTSNYHIFKLFERKEREIFQLPYYPDRITHHAVLNVIGDTLTKSFISQTYSCIKKRGIHKCLRDLNLALEDRAESRYCLKIDIKKYYPSVDNKILKLKLRTKFKDRDLLILLDEIIDSNQGLPIGNLLSQTFGNFYLNSFDHWLKEYWKVRYFRYCDDIVILDSSKDFLHNLRKEIQIYLSVNLKLELSNYQVFPVESRGIDFIGYKSYHDKILLRKIIKQNFKNMINKYPNNESKASYYGWLCHANTINLQNKYLWK